MKTMLIIKLFIMINVFILSTYAADINLIQMSKVGAYIIGDPVNTIYKTVTRKNTKIIDLELEGNFSPAVAIFENHFKKSSNPNLILEFNVKNDEFVISRIRILSRKYRLENGVSVGSTYGELREKIKNFEIVQGEGNTAIIFKDMRISFILDPKKLSKKYYENFDKKYLTDDLPISEIFIN